MAGVIVPIVVSALPVIAQIVPAIVRAVESLFPPKSGERKLNAAMEMVKSIAAQAASAGAAETVFDPAMLRGMVEQAVQQMKVAAGPVPDTGAPPVIVPEGAPFEVRQVWAVFPRLGTATVKITGT